MCTSELSGDLWRQRAADSLLASVKCQCPVAVMVKVSFVVLAE